MDYFAEGEEADLAWNGLKLVSPHLQGEMKLQL